jgi:hypothetical protein
VPVLAADVEDLDRQVARDPELEELPSPIPANVDGEGAVTWGNPGPRSNQFELLGDRVHSTGTRHRGAKIKSLGCRSS